MDMILHENGFNFKSFEKKVFDCGCKVAAEYMKECLQELDRQLMKSRDKSILRHKGHRKTCIKTLMGEVEYSRAVYEITDGSSERKFVYLLDEYMGFDNIGFVSSNLAEKIADNICVSSYASTAKNISELTGQRISHQGVWNVVQGLGQKIEQQENRYMELNKNDEFRGDRETKVLFEEADGVFVKMQKPYRSKHSNSREIKIAISHEGWMQTGKNRYELANKTVVCGIDSPRQFSKRKEAVISKIYNTDEIEMRIFNSDGGNWIKTLYENDDNTHFQLDPFHLKKIIKSCNVGKEFNKTINELLSKGEEEKAIDYVEAVINSVDNEKQEEKLLELYRYMANNKSGLVPYQNRGLNLPELNEGLIYHDMGNCEHNVYLAVAKRMKHQSACWSPDGSLNLCKLLCLKASHKLRETLTEISTVILPEKHTEETKNILGAGRIPKTVGKGCEGKHTTMPFEGVAVTHGRTAIRKMLGLKEICF